jgi:membrane-associated HD superfamily phosphohydrolase
VAEVIAQHHGTRLVGSFWAQAHAAGEGAARTAVDESLFRYPGPKPLSREAALVLIADACEASARELDRADGATLAPVVRRRIQEAFEEGQLDASELALRDLSAIADAMVRALSAVWAARPGAPPRPAEDGDAPQVKLVGDP